VSVKHAIADNEGGYLLAAATKAMVEMKNCMLSWVVDSGGTDVELIMLLMI
jgi:hypothetical protein